ncbi:chemokine-like protein TAFA-5 isoform X4 [Xenopus laevis]|uniref:Chemokine-like protein TAFA-5 isoform X4 n=1 Tax=Xenopus laevis TaxID=8355 RepID=A0A8J1MRK5_XENLA|nr:chemokine-like protein TAFA-5 isoform X4 [Xenopus laevis]
MQLLKALWALAGAAICCFLLFLIHSQILKEGQLAAGTCEVVTYDRDSSQPRRTIARQTARCACKKGQIAGTTRAKPACVDGSFKSLPSLCNTCNNFGECI